MNITKLIFRVFREKNYLSIISFLFLVGLAIRVFNVFYIPVFYAPDEEAHYHYIQYVFTNHQLPIAYAETGAENNDWEFYQPPFYYVITSFLFMKSQFAFSFYSIRMFSVFTYIFNYFLALKISKELILDKKALFIVASFIALLPSYVFLSSAINNDNLLITFSFLALYFTLKKNISNVKWQILLGIILGLSVLTKLTAVLILIFTFLLILKKKKLNFSAFLLIFGTSLVIAAPLFLRNSYLYHSFSGSEIANKIWVWQGSFLVMIENIPKYATWTFFSVAGINNDIRPFNFWFGFLLFFIYLIPFLMFFFKKDLLKKYSLVYVALFTVFINFLLVFWAGYRYHQEQGRFLFPSLFYIAYLTIIGIDFLGNYWRIFSKRSFGYVLAFLFLLTNFIMINEFRKIKTLDKYQEIKHIQQKKPLNTR